MSLSLIPVPESNKFKRNDRNDIRIGEIIHFVNFEVPEIQPGDICLIGFPEDRGVVRNHGREGSKEAPDAVKQAFYKLPASNAQFGISFQNHRILDLGNIDIGNSLTEAQNRLGRTVAFVLHHDAIPIVIGGGHETAYGHFLGYVEVRKEVSIINLDAHLDLRSIPSDGIGTSGTPFREIFEHPSGLIDKYSVLGAQPNSNSETYVEYAKDQKVSIEWLTDFNTHLKEYEISDFIKPSDENIYLTIDIDGFRSGDAPGTSAAQPFGFKAEDILPLVFKMAKNTKVTSFDLCEINPKYDRDNQTAKLGAHLIYQFISGVWSRK